MKTEINRIYATACDLLGSVYCEMDDYENESDPYEYKRYVNLVQMADRIGEICDLIKEVDRLNEEEVK